MRGVKKTTTTATPVVVARGGRERSNPAKTTTTLRDGRKGDPQLNVVGKNPNICF